MSDERTYLVEFDLDPPRGTVPDNAHDFVRITAESSDPALLEWTLKHFNDYIAWYSKIVEER